MSTKSKDLYYDVDALDTVKEKISSLHKSYIVPGPASDANNVNSSGSKIRNILNTLDSYDNSYDNCFSKYDLPSKANIIYNKSQNFMEKWLDFDNAFVTSYKLLGDSTTTATTILNEFEGLTEEATPPRINSPYDYAEYLKKQGKDKEYASLMALITSGGAYMVKTGTENVTKNGTKSNVSTTSNSNTGGYTTSSGTTVTYSPTKKDNTKEETTSQEISTEEELKQKEEELRKKEEELQHKEREQSDRETALDTQEKQLKEKEKDLDEREKQLDQREEEIKAKEEELKAKEKELVANPTTPGSDNDHGLAPKPDEGLLTKEPEENPANTVSEPSNDTYETPVQVDTSPNEQQPSSQVNNTQQNNSYQAPSEQANNDYSNQNVTVPPTQGSIAGSSNTGSTPDLFAEPDEPASGTGGAITDLPDNSSSSSSSSSSTKSSKGFNPVPLAVGLGAAALGGVGVKAYKSHKENSDFDDANEDSFTNGNRFWSDEEPNTIHTEQNELSGEDLLKEQATAPSYEAMLNGNNDTWSIEDDSQNDGSDNQTFDLLS